MPQYCGYDISPSLSTSSNEDSTPISTLQFAIVQNKNNLLSNKQQSSSSSHATAAPATIESSALNRRICNDLRLCANKSFSQNIRPARPYLPPRRIDGSTYDNQNSFENRLQPNRLSEKRQSDPQIRYAFYNKGFEVATSTKHRKYSLSHYEVRRKAMPDIDEYGSMENDESSDEWQGSRQNLQYYSGSSGRDITLLPKLKIRICDEMGARIKHSFDESSFSDDNFNIDDSTASHSTITNDNSIDKFTACEHIKTSTVPESKPKTSAKSESIPNDNNMKICKKCGHRLAVQKQFTNAFV